MLSSKYCNPVVAIHHENASLAVWVGAVVGKSQLVAPVPGIQHPLLVEVEEVRIVDLVIDATPPICFVLRDQIAGVLANEVTFLCSIMQKCTPSCHNGLPHYHALVLTQAQAHVVALRLRWCAAFAHGIAVPAQVWVTFPSSSQAGARAVPALTSAAASLEPVGALWPTSTILLTEVLVLHARAVAGTHTRAISTAGACLELGPCLVHLVGQSLADDCGVLARSTSGHHKGHAPSLFEGA
eukprot:CAMPEP_0202384776 /NCGR_PEP_ID=MMETSP1127-20130417/57099_1 /ASSEMBLY_ACC=CAM_ASM_000462 /TAXON_ID=3047 /ORGANISM="Dunaliella tertiolecta, Strain CCMP1320" /LENGTH=239 /DNA_ID=CAMNT_0048984719 /DNA_START=592 /DNA_END=1308 /DNA_ORIENTATION=+